MFTQTLRSAAVRGTYLATRSTLIPRTAPTFTRKITSSRAARAAASHDDHEHESPYDEPGGWLWGVPPGEKRENEGWEWAFFYVMYPALAVTGVVYAMKEDTSIQTWALEEARRRLEKEGILEDPFPENK